jgi:hypothetical protein
MTPEQIRLARHALGLPNRDKRSFRNRSYAARGTPEFKAWVDLEDRGLAKRHDVQAFSIGFALTEAGARRSIDPVESLDRKNFPATPHNGESS